MRGHVVGAFGVVHVFSIWVFSWTRQILATARRRVLWGNLLEQILQIDLHVRVGVLLDQERGRGVAAIERQETGGDPLLRHPTLHRRRDLDEPLAVRRDGKLMLGLAHETSVSQPRSP